jgi:hypothetical protein
LETATLHSSEDGVVLAIAVASVQEPEEPILGTDEVRPTDGVEPVMETVDAPTPMIEDHTPEEKIARINIDTEWDTVLLCPPSSPISTVATSIVAREVPAERTVREQATEIMMMLEMAIERVCAWLERKGRGPDFGDLRTRHDNLEPTTRELQRVVETEERVVVPFSSRSLHDSGW